MNTENIRYQIALTQIKGVGDVLAKNLIAYVGCAEDIFKQSKAQLIKIPNIGEYVASQIIKNSNEALVRADKEIAFIEKNKITPIFFTEKNYPFRLKECADAPILLYSKGNIEYNKGIYVGIVGTRKATEYGKSFCQDLIKNLAQTHPDVLIISGLAYGRRYCIQLRIRS